MSTPPQTTTVLLRPWPQFISGATLSLPISLSEASHRLSHNLHYYALNYTLITLLIFLLSLLPHPLPLIFFLILSASWYYLYFIYTQPLEVFGYPIDNTILLSSFICLSVVGLFFGRVWGSFVVAVAIGGGVSVVHAVVKAPEEGVDGSPYGALLSDSGGGGEYFRV
ncbi:membrane traffic protein [Lithospermum erythrorhizon]|uniref:PRA1 family protein n=1 Tax=Lithospermum erythrorhizon TaxID=34254 RepID=A0AAV3NSG7_LITER